MSLEDILKITKVIVATAKQDLWDRPDAWVWERYHAIEERIGNDTISISAGLTGALTLIIPECPSKHPPLLTLYSMISGISCLTNIPNYIKELGSSRKETIDGEKLSSNNEGFLNEYNRVMRFPLLIATAASLYYPFVENANYMTHSIVGFGTVSFLYLTDNERPRKQKDPFWKRAYEYVREKAEEMIQEPTPEAIPVRRYVSVETPSL